MRRIHTLLLYILIPFIIIRMLWRSISIPEHRLRMKERFGFIPKVPHPTGVWIHAVSVGEVQASVPLIEHFLNAHPQFTVVVTTATPTGSQHVQKLFGKRVYHCYIPYDIPLAVRRFVKTIRPLLAIFIETEVWPNILYECKKRNIYTVLANARMSEHSMRNYASLGSLAQEAFGSFTYVIAQSVIDAQRLQTLGVNSEFLSVSGNIKFDLNLPPNLNEHTLILKEAWGKERPIWIAASTHAGEEAQVLEAHSKILDSLPNALLVLVPRHPERFGKVKQLILKQGFELVCRSERQPCNLKTQVFLGDSMGELMAFFAAADVAFIGGSLVPHGGHNMLEPAALGMPVITGPYVMNFIDITATLLAAGAVLQVTTAAELAAVALKWLQNAELRHQVGEQGRLVIEANRGALGRLINILDVLVTMRKLKSFLKT